MRKNSMYKSLEPYAKLVNFLSAALGDNCEIAFRKRSWSKIIKFIFTLFRRKTIFKS